MRKARHYCQVCHAQARRPEFYRRGGVPDTPQGHFDLLCLHASLFLIACKQQKQNALAQAFFDQFFKDMEQGLRLNGVSDLSIPRKNKGLMRALNGRVRAFDAALHGKRAQEDVIRQNLLDQVQEEDGDAVIKSWADYMRDSFETLSASQLELALPADNLFARWGIEPQTADEGGRKNAA